jgi:hypothetical protein
VRGEVRDVQPIKFVDKNMRGRVYLADRCVDWRIMLKHILSRRALVLRTESILFLYGSTALYGHGPPRFVEVS